MGRCWVVLWIEFGKLLKAFGDGEVVLSTVFFVHYEFAVLILMLFGCYFLEFLMRKL